MEVNELIERLRALSADDAEITTAELIRYAAAMTEAADALTKAQERVEALEAALKPFADKADLIDAADDDSYTPDWSPFIPVGAYRIARTTLKQQEDRDD